MSIRPAVPGTPPSSSSSSQVTFMSVVRAQAYGLFAAVAYSIFSILIVFYNKYTFNVVGFRYPILLCAIQQICILVFVIIAKNLKWIPCDDFELRKLRILWPIAVAQLLNIIVGVAALASMSVPMLTVMRKLTVLLVLILDYVLRKKREERGILYAICLMVSGSFIAALADLNFDLQGYIFAFLNNLLTALYLVFIKKLSADANANAYTLLYYTAIVSVPTMSIMSSVFGEWHSATTDFHLLERGSDIWFALLVNGVLACVVNYFTYLCTQVNSPLTTTVTGQAKNLFSVIIGFFAFNEYRFSWMNFFGVCVVYTGSVWFAVQRYRESRERQRQQQKEKPVELLPIRADSGSKLPEDHGVSFSSVAGANLPPGIEERRPLLENRSE